VCAAKWQAANNFHRDIQKSLRQSHAQMQMRAHLLFCAINVITQDSNPSNPKNIGAADISIDMQPDIF